MVETQVGQQREVLATLARSDKIDSAWKAGRRPANIAFFLILHFNLGQKEQAQPLMHELRQLMKRPPWSRIAETQGSDTAQSAVRVAVIMRANGLHSCVAVSDAYHVFRIKRLLEHEGIGPVYVAPRPDSRPHSAVQRAYAVMRETSSYLLWKLGIT